MAQAEPTRPSRNRALDGLRGLAAVAVVLGHIVVATNVVQASQYFGDARPLTGANWLFSQTPLVILWSGQEWVIVFFVLSGFVLSLAAAEGARFDAPRYYPARIVRLYVPVWACLLFAAAVHETIRHERVAGATVWLNMHVTGWSVTTTAHEMLLLLDPGDFYFTTVLWSLRWEVAFSLLLPLFLLCARRLPLWLLAAGSLLAVAVGGPRSGVLAFMPVFMLGTVFAYGREQVRTTLADARLYWLTLAASPVALTATHWLPAGGWRGPALGLVALGASGFVATAMIPGPFGRLLETRPMQHVGRRSFSLYLVHEPLVVATAFALGGRPSTALLAVCSIPPIALATVAFYRWIERPSQGMARAAGATAARVARRGPPAPRPSRAGT
jgi:peptidoglycan/LPS O-acetylase OafA/YrhL